MIDIDKEITAIIRKIHEFAARGIADNRLCLYTGDDFCRRLTCHLTGQGFPTESTVAVREFWGVKIVEIEDLEGWRVDEDFRHIEQSVIYGYDRNGDPWRCDYSCKFRQSG